MAHVSFDFSGHSAIVTGATKGIGRATALALSAAGCRVGVTGRSQQELDSLKSEIEQSGGFCEIYAADLADATQATEMAEFLCRRLDPVTILVNNAGVSFPERLVDMEVAHWDATLDINLRAPALVAKIVARGMIRRKAGSIVNVASLSSVTGLAEHAAYCASKFGLHGLTKVMALELGPDNVRVNAVGPTVVLTPMGVEVWGDPAKGDPMKAKIPLGRFAQPGDVVNAILFLASDAASMITGELLLVDGGYMAQ